MYSKSFTIRVWLCGFSQGYTQHVWPISTCRTTHIHKAQWWYNLTCMQQHKLTHSETHALPYSGVYTCMCVSCMLLYTSVCAACKCVWGFWHTGVKALVSVFTGIYYAIVPAFIALILVATLSLVLTVLHLPQLLYSVCVCICECAVCARQG